MRFGNGYLGSGMHMIEEIFHHGHTAYYAFALKMLFTALTLGAGFKGGEIVPTLTVGAAFGCCVAMLFGLDVPLLAACGMVGLFCGVTNSPLTSLLLGLELFGAAGMPYYLITVAVSYLISGRESFTSSKNSCAKRPAPVFHGRVHKPAPLYGKCFVNTVEGYTGRLLFLNECVILQIHLYLGGKL